MSSFLSQGGFLAGAPFTDLRWFPITAEIMYRKVINSWISQNELHFFCAVPKHDAVSCCTEASWLCLLLSRDVSSVLQPDISVRPGPGLPQAPWLDKRPAIIAHFKDASQSKTAFMHLFWQTPVDSPSFASPPFHLPPPYPSSSFPTNPHACLDERLGRETSANRVWFGTDDCWHTVYWNISLHSFPLT